MVQVWCRATAAYQIEGAWNVSDKSPSVWDTFLHKNPSYAADNSTGDVACDSYNLWQRDIEIAKEMGLHFYRFSISWPRLLPSGFPNRISEDGNNYYSKLIDGLLKNNIEPVVTLYHFDLPQRLQDLGGWANPLIADWFADYARVAFTLYGDRVKTWLTINEPMIICELTYEGFLPPIIKDPEIGSFLCNKNILMAHAKAWRVYDEEFRPKYNGTYDYLGFNHYTSWTVKKSEPGDKGEGFMNKVTEYNVTIGASPEWKRASSFWFKVNPEGIRKSLVWLKKKYGNIEILITENGYSTTGKNINDDVRVEYYRDYLDQILLAIKEDGVNVTGYTAWTLMDNFEWADGYTTNFGLYHVDFEDPMRRRTPRKSAQYYATVIRAHSLAVPETRDEL